MTKTEFSLAYSRCSDNELQRFILDRGVDVSANSSRKAIIRALRADDLKATFRFMDLPAELRNNVYEELLYLRNKGGLKYQRSLGGISHRKWCWPAILATSKEIHKEAESILYSSEDKILVEVSLLNKHTVGSRDYPMHPHVAVNHKSIGFDESWQLEKQSLDWPLAVPKFKNIRLVVDVQEPTWIPEKYESASIPINHILYDFLNLMRRSKRLPRIHGEFYSFDIESVEYWKTVLAPTNSICGPPNDPDTSDEIKNTVKDAILYVSKNRNDNETLEKYYNLRRCTEWLLGASPSLVNEKLTKAFRSILQNLADLFSPEKFITVEADAELRTTLKNLNELLRQVCVKHVKLGIQAGNPKFMPMSHIVENGDFLRMG